MNNKPIAWMYNYENFPDSFVVCRARKSDQDIPLYTHPVKELNDGGEPVKNATYWKRQYNLMATQNDNLKSGLYHANEQIKYLESHPAKEQDEQFKKGFEVGKEEGWKAHKFYHPVKEQDESFDRTASHMAGEYVSNAEPVAWIDPKELDMDVSTSVTKNKQFESDIPLYVQPQKYCPSENNEAYEKGFIDGMAKQRDSRVQQMVEGYAQLRELTDEEINKLWAESHEDGIATQQGFTTQQHYFANLILRKASEK